MRVVSEADAIQNFPALLRDPDEHPIVINDGENDLRVIVSMDDYEIVRLAKSIGSSRPLTLLAIRYVSAQLKTVSCPRIW